MDFQTIYDEKKRETGVFIPIAEWRKIKARLGVTKKSKREPRVLKELEQAVTELNLIKSGKKKTPRKNLSQLLDEL